MPSDEFSAKFRPLSHHLFPDGCPDASLEEIWPRPAAADATRRRTSSSASYRSLAHVTSGEQALESLQDLKAYARRRRLSAAHIDAVAWVLHRMATATDLASVLVSDRRHCRDLLQSLLPRERHAVSRGAVTRLLSIPKARERSMVLRFLTLAIQTGDWLSVEAFDALTGSYLYANIFQAALAPATGVDAVRLLLRLTSARHATWHRIRRIELARARLLGHAGRGDVAAQRGAEALSTLSSLLEGITVSGAYKPTYEATVHESGLADFPDQDWERQFANAGGLSAAPEQTTKKLHGDILRVLRQPPAYSGSLIDILTNRSVHQALLLSQAERLRFRAFLVHALVPAQQDIDAVTQYESQIDVMRALAVCTRKSLWMPREIEEFVLESVLPSWDGTESPWGTILCHELIPYIPPPKSFRYLKKRLLPLLAPHCLYGGGRQQLLIIHAVKGIVEHWSMLGDEEGGGTDAQTIDRIDHCSTRSETTELLRRLVLYMDDLILKTFLNLNGGDELLHMAAVDFYESLGSLHERGWPFVGAPSPALTYRLLLAPSASSIDRACRLILSLESSFQILMESTTALKIYDAVLAQDRIKVFNAFVWDYVSLLWTGSRPTAAAYDDRSILHNELSIATRSILEHFGKDSAKPLSVFSGAPFAGYVSRFLKEHSRHEQRPATVDAIGGSMKVEYLEELRARGFLGIYYFLSTFVGSLAQHYQSSSFIQN